MADDQAPVFIDPDVARLLEASEPVYGRASQPLAEARAQMEEMCRFWNRELPDLPRVEELVIEGPGGPLRARMMWPEDETGLPLVVYFHGGGWTLGSIDSHHRLMRMLALASGAALLAVDYRLSPEAAFPEPLEDCLAAVGHARARAAALSIDRGRLVLAGDSAGANLALGSLLALRDRDDLGGVRGAALFYGCYVARTDSPSHRAFGDGSLRLSTAEMDWFWRNYLGEHGQGHPHAEPLHADLAGLPPLFLNCGASDPLLDDSRDLAARLEAVGAPHRYAEYPGLVHGFLQMTLDVAASRTAMAEAGAAIRDMLGPR
ncbi:MAG TPA: alpha/beta hydrolase [Geminicoccaceae bacterium]